MKRGHTDSERLLLAEFSISARILLSLGAFGDWHLCDTNYLLLVRIHCSRLPQVRYLCANELMDGHAFVVALTFTR